MLKIFLASNNLMTLPAELFNLNRLTVLSVRANEIYELPPGIGKLSSLQELNISQNRLNYLPFEILDLFSDKYRLESFATHPNPFFKPRYAADQDFDSPFPSGWPPGGTKRLSGWIIGRRHTVSRTVPCISNEERRRSWHPQWNVSYKARAEVRFLDINGSLLKGPNFTWESRVGVRKYYPNALPVAEMGDKPTPPAPRGNHLSRAPSLLETALGACIRAAPLSHLLSQLPELCPEYLPALLRKAAAKKESGSTKCTICGRDFFIPRTEWIEWWEIAKSVEDKGTLSAASPLRQMENERDVVERMIPLIRRGCSWLCVPETETEPIKVEMHKDPTLFKRMRELPS